MNVVKLWILYSFNKDKAYSFFQVLSVKQGHFVIKISVSFVFGMILKKRLQISLKFYMWKHNHELSHI